MFTPSEIFDLAIRLEENGEAFYRANADIIADSAIQTLILRLAEDEKEHRECFEGFKRSCEALGLGSEMDSVSGQMLQDIIGKRAFSLDEVEVARVESEADLYRHAIEFEKDTIVFYEMIRGFLTDSAAIEQIDRIIDMEKSHVDQLSAQLRVIEKRGRTLKIPVTGH